MRYEIRSSAVRRFMFMVTLKIMIFNDEARVCTTDPHTNIGMSSRTQRKQQNLQQHDF